MDDVIKNLCKVLQQEAEVVKSYTDLMHQSADMESIQVFAVNRIEAVQHIQKLTLELSNCIQDESSKMTEVEYETEQSN